MASRLCFFFQAEDGIRDLTVTGVQTCALPIYRREQACQRQCPVNGVNDGYDEVVQHHRPAREKSQVRMQCSAHVCVRRTRGWVDSRHPPVTNRGQHHSNHSNQNGGNDVAPRKLVSNSKERDRCDRCDKDYPIEDEVPERQDTTELDLWLVLDCCLGIGSSGQVFSSCHSALPVATNDG